MWLCYRPVDREISRNFLVDPSQRQVGHPWCTGSGFWSPIRPVINNFLDLDWISFPFQPDSEPDYPNEKNCGHAKNLIWNNRCIRENYGISKSY